MKVKPLPVAVVALLKWEDTADDPTTTHRSDGGVYTCAALQPLPDGMEMSFIARII